MRGTFDDFCTRMNACQAHPSGRVTSIPSDQQRGLKENISSVNIGDKTVKNGRTRVIFVVTIESLLKRQVGSSCKRSHTAVRRRTVNPHIQWIECGATICRTDAYVRRQLAWTPDTSSILMAGRIKSVHICTPMKFRTRQTNKMPKEAVLVTCWVNRVWEFGGDIGVQCSRRISKLEMKWNLSWWWREEKETDGMKFNIDLSGSELEMRPLPLPWVVLRRMLKTSFGITPRRDRVWRYARDRSGRLSSLAFCWWASTCGARLWRSLGLNLWPCNNICWIGAIYTSCRNVFSEAQTWMLYPFVCKLDSWMRSTHLLARHHKYCIYKGSSHLGQIHGIWHTCSWRSSEKVNE